MADRKIQTLKKACTIVRECLEMLAEEIAVGVNTKSLEEKATDFILSKDAKPAFLGYKGFPASICTSVNEVVVHGIPSRSQVLKEADIISVDVGVEYNGYFADAAKTFEVGTVDEEAKRLISVTEEALKRGIRAAKEGNRVQDISWAVQTYVESNGFSVVRSFVGHGIGKHLHENPEIPNFGQPHKGAVLENGMALAIEPMVNVGTKDVLILADGWT
ncbi:MAG: type I methionyl aminopeptidase, partial [Candidatus Omnitrophota bacterium]